METDIDRILISRERIAQRVEEMAGEIHVIHHAIEKDRIEEAGVVPFQTKRWWEFWKT